MRRLPLLAVLAPLALAAAPAQAAERSAAAGGSSAAVCTAVDPCDLATALANANAGDHVVLAPGTYTLAGTLTVDEAITLRGEAGRPRPVLKSSTATTLDVEAAATLRHLKIESTFATGDAVQLKGGPLVEDVLVETTGDVGKATNEGTTVIRDSVLRTTGAARVGLKLYSSGPGGSVTLRNVTLSAPGAGSPDLDCKPTSGTATLVNSVVVGDVEAASSGCTAQHSSIGSHGAGVTVTNAPSGPPVFVDAAAGDFHPAPGSPTIDAGTTAGPHGGAADPDGVSRGSAPDVGAYEYRAPAPGTDPGGADDPDDAPGPGPGETQTTTTPGGTTTAPQPDTGTSGTPPATTPAEGTDTPLPLDVAAPRLGRTVTLDAERGTVRVKLPGSAGFVALADAASLPVGTVIDTRQGSVTLETALPGGRTQSGTFGGGRFEVRQPRGRRGLTDIVLRGGSFAACGRRARPRGVVARAAGRPRPVRRLWAKDKGGRFRTHGRRSVATVRGTRWLTEDRCEGTLTRVTEGAVDVRDRRTGQVRRVRAGRSLLVRGR